MRRPTLLKPIDPESPDSNLLDEAARVLRSGGLVAFPTETVYGLGADASSTAAVARIFEAKGRPSKNPLIVHVVDLEGAKACVSRWTEFAEVLAKAFWPGPLTLVLPRAAWVPPNVSAGRETVGVRVPASLVARSLIERTGRPIAAPSANRSTGISPTRASHVLKDLDGQVDLILDAGPCAVGLESSVVDLSGKSVRLLRPGAVSLESISRILGGTLIEIGPDVLELVNSFSSPGQMDVHYAPKTPTWRIGSIPGLKWRSIVREGRWGIVAFGNVADFVDERVIRLETPDIAAERLYSTLHELDEAGLDGLLLIEPPATPEWRAVLDRVRRAGRSAKPEA